MGKSRFARECILPHLAWTASARLGLDGGSLNDLCSVQVAEEVIADFYRNFPPKLRDKRSKDEISRALTVPFVQNLICAYFEHRNLRINFDDVVDLFGRRNLHHLGVIEAALAAIIVFEHIKYRIPCASDNGPSCGASHAAISMLFTEFARYSAGTGNFYTNIFGCATRPCRMYAVDVCPSQNSLLALSHVTYVIQQRTLSSILMRRISRR